MSAQVLDPDYQWKEAASREGVDYEAVQKSFMDQAYGVVANKAKILFQDPFRLGFEIVHRNEKATRMVGIFAFRVNGEILYAPVFFVNGEIKPADMIYRSDVKRFTPLTEDWCSFLVRGAKEEGGAPVERNRTRQADAYMDRLAYPQRVKYASTDTPFSFTEILRHCSDNSPLPPLVPRFIDENGPETLEKLAAMIEGSDIAQRYVARTYTEEQLTTCDTWLAKEAAAEAPHRGISVITSPSLCKSAGERDRLMSRGYELIDTRPDDTINHTIVNIEDGIIQELSAACCADVLTGDGNTTRALLLDKNHMMGEPSCVSFGDPYVTGPGKNRSPECIYYPETKELGELHGVDVFGHEPDFNKDEDIPSCGAKDLKKGKAYIMVDIKTMCCSDVFQVKDITPDGESLRIKHCRSWGGDGSDFIYSPGREHAEGRYISDHHCFLEVKVEKEGKGDGFSTICKIAPMSSGCVDQWLRTAGNTTESADVHIEKNQNDLFNVTQTNSAGVVKQASDLGMLAAHLLLAEDFSLTTDQAGKLLDKTVDGDVSYRVYNSLSKSGYVTRQEGMEDWITSFDPQLQVQLDAPQQQILSTHTPTRARQHAHVGDTWQKELDGRNPDGGKEDGLPMDALLTRSPEDLAQMSQAYDMPHIFDHGALEQMSTTTFSVADQIKQYIPDLETGVDRLFRILFLLRYRPADFEENYGRDALLEMESELSELALTSGENLLRLLKRFDIEQYNAK